jgi:hypothetical protein
MKNLALLTIFGISIAVGATAHVGYGFDIDENKTICLSKTYRLAEVLQEVMESAVSMIHTACEELPGAGDATSKFKSIEIQDAGACGFSLIRYGYHVTASCLFRKEL